ncbi:MAG: YkuS family protein [Pseudomonadota bacterium]
MVIAIQRGLENIKEELERRGYDVFYIGESRVADAVLYKELDAYPHYEAAGIQSAASASVGGNSSFGSLLVNVTNKSMEEIYRILEKRVYSPLL